MGQMDGQQASPKVSLTTTSSIKFKARETRGDQRLESGETLRESLSTVKHCHKTLREQELIFLLPLYKNLIQH